MKSIFNALIGNATQISDAEVRSEYPHMFLNDETVEFAFKLVRDKWVFTSKRLILIDVQGITGSKKELHSIPYKSIYHFSVESAGTFDMDSEIKLWIAGGGGPMVKQMKRGFDVYALQRILTYYTCK